MLSLFVVLLIAGGATPANLEKQVHALAQAVASRDWQQAARLATAVEAETARRAPLEVLDGRVLVAPATGLGIYHPAPGGVIRGEELYLYAQVRHHHSREVSGGFELHLVSDLVILDASGQELARDEGFGESRFVARARHRDTFVNIALRAKGLPTGSYVVRLIVHDRIGGGRARVDVPFKMP